jgi:hypothetical protein
VRGRARRRAALVDQVGEAGQEHRRQR